MATEKSASRSNHSRQRDAILKILCSTTSHPTANWIYQKAREEIPNISLGTVYRNLSTLAERGEILRFNVGDEMDHFDGNSLPHYHMFCSGCGRVIDLPVPYLKELDETAEKAGCSNISHHLLCFFGRCSDCNSEN